MLVYCHTYNSSSFNSFKLLIFFRSLFKFSGIKMMHLNKQFEHMLIQLEAIKSATNNFDDSNCIGRGGFGKVYKGEVLYSMRRTVVAFKRLDPKFGQGNPEFWKEITMLSLCKHENIVSLLGFCNEGNEKILMYEYASRRSLDLYLNKVDLTWIDRLKICIGAARGLAYLHNPGGTQQRVLHRDVKSSNILLDENWNPKISDMGLSKIGPANQKYTFLVSNPVGTIGYCDPLYIETGLLTKESDVYSFGIVLFEVLCGRLSISNESGGHQSFAGLVRQHYKQNKIKEIIFVHIKDTITTSSLDTFIKIAFQCLKRDLEKRPLMTDVVRMLEDALECQYGGGGPSRLITSGQQDIPPKPILEVRKFKTSLIHCYIARNIHRSQQFIKEYPSAPIAFGLTPAYTNVHSGVAGEDISHPKD